MSAPSSRAGVGAVHVVGDEEAEHRVAEELEPLVALVLGVLGAPGAVGEGLGEQGVVGGLVAERGDEPVPSEQRRAVRAAGRSRHGSGPDADQRRATT